MNPALLAALIQQVGLPEFLNWLHSRNGEVVTDESIIAMLNVDTNTAITNGQAWLASHPEV